MALEPYHDISGVILVGGKSQRMGQDKALLPIQGKLMIERALDLFQQHFRQVFLVGDRPERFGSYQFPVVPDLFPGSSLGGLYTGLYQAAHEYVFVSSCDMPFPSAGILRHICDQRHTCDAVIPCSNHGPEPLFACYAKTCLPTLLTQLQQHQLSIRQACSQLRTTLVPYADLSQYDRNETAFLNLNTPEELARAQDR